ncbi:MAG: nuclear transport factor 2 family protein, partial [Actinomycetota bacterium]
SRHPHPDTPIPTPPGKSEFSMTMIDTAPSPLDSPPSRYARRPFYAETLSLLRSVRDHDFETLANLCDDDFGIVDVDPAGQARPIRTRVEWERWFHELFATLDSMGAATDSEILGYQAMVEGTMGMSVLDFRQTLTVGEHVASFDCVATIVWKRTDHGWREARWHASVISSEVPEALLAAA